MVPLTLKQRLTLHHAGELLASVSIPCSVQEPNILSAAFFGACFQYS